MVPPLRSPDLLIAPPVGFFLGAMSFTLTLGFACAAFGCFLFFMFVRCEGGEMTGPFDGQRRPNLCKQALLILSWGVKTNDHDPCQRGGIAPPRASK